MNIKIDATLVYQHPDGFTLAFHNNTLVATDDGDNAVSLPIGPLGLVALADKLRAIGTTSENLAEQVGRELAIDALSECRTAENQGERFDILRGVMLSLAEWPDHRLAAAGFAAADIFSGQVN